MNVAINRMIDHFLADWRSADHPPREERVASSILGDALTVCYSDDGAVAKIVDESTGAYMKTRLRDDGAGREYAIFDASGHFLGGGNHLEAWGDRRRVARS